MTKEKEVKNSAEKMDESINENFLTEEEIWDILKFAKGLSTGAFLPTGFLSPDLINSRMKDITLNPLVPTSNDLERALANPKESEDLLRQYSEGFETRSQSYKSLISYLGNMLSWDFTYSCKNAEYEDYGTRAYKRDLKVLEDFTDSFDFKKEFSVVVRQLLRQEAFFCCPRDTGDKLILQELPSSYCQITGRWGYGLLFSFNMTWFVQPGVDIELYPKFFRDKFNEFGRENLEKASSMYAPTLDPTIRGDTFYYIVDVPVDVGWCWKMTPEIATRIPYFSGLFSELILQPTMRELQKNSNMASASKMLVGEVPMLKDSGANAKVKDMIAIKPELLGKFLALVQSSVSEAIKVATAPLENMQGISFSSDTDLYKSFMDTALSTAGLNTTLLFSSDQKMNSIDSQLSLNTDEQLMEALYPQFNSFMEWYINENTKKFKFEFLFEGTNFFTNRNNRLDKQKDLIAQGIVLPQKIASAIGMKPTTFQRQLDEARASGFVDGLTPIIPAAQQSADVGRPQSSDSEISESGAQTRDTASNVGRGGKVDSV